MSGIASWIQGKVRQIAATTTQHRYATRTIVAVLTAASSQRPPAERWIAAALRLRVGIGRRGRREEHHDGAHARHVDRGRDLDRLEHAVVAGDLRDLADDEAGGKARAQAAGDALVADLDGRGLGAAMALEPL